MDMDIKNKHKYTISSTPVQHRLLIDNLIIHHFLKQVAIFPKLNSQKFKADFLSYIHVFLKRPTDYLIYADDYCMNLSSVQSASDKGARIT